jgi:hypothetical protein
LARVRTATPAELWQRDNLVVAVETIDLAGETVPLSFSQLTVEDRQITASFFHPVAWGKYPRGSGGQPCRGELVKALATAGADRRLTLAELDEGDMPLAVFGRAGQVLRCAAQQGSLVVTHSQDRLRALLDAVEAWLDVDLPPVSVVSTAVLERARRLGASPERGEPDSSFYRRAAGLVGDLPGLTRCRAELQALGLPPAPAGRMFPATMTHLIYQCHFGGRLLRPAGPGPDR